MRKKPFFLLGDLNNNLLLPNSKLLHIIASNKLTQVINTPTRITPTSSTLLDVIITNKPDLVTQSYVIPCTVADHELIGATVNILKPKRLPVTVTKRDLRNYNSDLLCSHILEETSTLNEILRTDNVDKQVSILTSVITTSLDKSAPISSVVIRRPPAPWINDEIKEALAERKKAQMILKNNRYNMTLHQKYKEIKKNVKSLIKSSKKKYYHQELHTCKNNTAATWNTLKTIIPSKTQASATPPLENLKDKAEDFNEFFANVGLNTYESTQNSLKVSNSNHLHEAPNIPVVPSTLTNIAPFRPQPVDQNTVILTIKQLRNTKSFGSDNISLRFIKDSLFAIVFYLTTLINTSIVTGIFPASWKHAVVTPLFKNGNPDEIGNYRPVSLLPIFSKILEKVVANQLTSFLERNKLFSPTQHGFRPKLSTETALQVITDKIYDNMDNKKISLLTLCDLSKAFDSVSHTILLQKLRLINIDTFWFDNYLDGRSQSVRLKDIVSTKRSVTFGVPQGSILGPTLFNIHVNDIVTYIDNCLIIQYADDTQFLHSGTVNKINTLITNTETTLKQLRIYFLHNGLQLNINKTQCIFLGTRQLLAHIPNTTTIRCAEGTIQPSFQIKNLGLHLDSHMTFSKHIHEITRKTMGTLSFINRHKDLFNKETRVMVIHTLVLSIINYCITVWGTTNSTLISKVQKVQNFAIKVADGKARKYDHVTPLFKDFQWLKIKDLITFTLITKVFKQKIKDYPDHILSLPTVNNMTDSTTRQQNNLYVPRTNTDAGARSTHVLGPKLWNQLPNEIKDSHTLTSLKSSLKKKLLTST